MENKKVGLMIALLMSTNGWADDNLILQGTLLEPPDCTFNIGVVDFGERVGVNKVDGKNYKQTINYSLVCEADLEPWAMSLFLTGEVTPYDNAAIQSNMDDLGIRLLIDGKPFMTNILMPFNPDKLPVIEAVPVKKPGSTLTAGAFSAAATLWINYQ